MLDKIEIDNQYINHRDSYTYRQILVGLRKEFLEFQKKLDQLSEYVFIFEKTKEQRDSYYFNLYKNPLDNKKTELVLDRTIIKKRLLEKLGLRFSPTRSFMVKDNNGVYYPLRKYWFEENEFNMVIKPGCEKEFQECAEEILNSDFAKYMMQLNSNISAVTSEPFVSKNSAIITPNLTSFGFDLRTCGSEIKYLGRHNMIQFKSLRHPSEEQKLLTQEHLDYVSTIRFPKDAFSEYHRSIIDNSIDDNRPIVLSEEYQPEILTRLEIQDTPKQLVLTKTQSKRIV